MSANPVGFMDMPVEVINHVVDLLVDKRTVALDVKNHKDTPAEKTCRSLRGTNKYLAIHLGSQRDLEVQVTPGQWEAIRSRHDSLKTIGLGVPLVVQTDPESKTPWKLLPVRHLIGVFKQPHLRRSYEMIPDANRDHYHQVTLFESLNYHSFCSHLEDVTLVYMAAGPSWGLDATGVIDQNIALPQIDSLPSGGQEDGPRQGAWYGFCYYEATQKVDFRLLTWADVEAQATATMDGTKLKGVWYYNHDLIIRVWIVKDGQRPPPSQQSHTWTKLEAPGARSPKFMHHIAMLWKTAHLSINTIHARSIGARER